MTHYQTTTMPPSGVNWGGEITRNTPAAVPDGMSGSVPGPMPGSASGQPFSTLPMQTGMASTAKRGEITRNTPAAVPDGMSGSVPGPMPGSASGQPFSTLPMQTGMASTAKLMTGGAHLDMKNDLPQEVLESPTTVQEAYKGSLRAMLARNEGNYIVATFLVGTQNTVSFEGVLYDVGNDYVTIYQPGRDRYIVSDLYSLKYMEFYDTRRRELRDALLRQNGWENQNP